MTNTDGADTEAAATCRWVSFGDGWDTECGEAFVLIAGGTAENGFKYCPYCGGALPDTPKFVRRRRRAAAQNAAKPQKKNR